MSEPGVPATLGDAVLREAFALAVDTSRRSRGFTTPNPPVGAVVLDRDARVVSVGATEEPGGRHAEVVALDAAGALARGGTIVVTLEPCAHTGRTGPCTERIISAGVADVVYGCPDPGEDSGGGADILREAGVSVVEDAPGAELCPGGPLRPWLHRLRTGRPLVTWKYAATLDGYVAAADGTSKWITGPESRAHAHVRRAAVDALIVGTGTLLADDPSLTARHPDGSLRSRSPRACVMGRSQVPTVSAVRRSPGGFTHLDTHDPLEALALLGDVLHVLVEGGPTLAAAFLRVGLVDEIDAYLAPVLLGAGTGVVTDLGVSTLLDAHRFDVQTTERLGADVYVHLRSANA